METKYKKIDIEDLEVFYRCAGNKNNPVILLLHGFPTSSFMFRNLIPLLSKDYYVIAPDYIGFGYSSMPSVDEFNYSFDSLYEIILKFINKIGLNKFTIYIQDYGAPIGLRIAYRNPDMINSIITQNGNAYIEGLGEAWNPIFDYQKNRNIENENKVRKIFTLETTKWQYTHGVDDKKLKELITPDTWNLDYALLCRPGNDKIQLQLFYDYQINIKLYKEFHNYFRKYKPPLLAIWGKNDDFFVADGAKAFKKDLPNAEVILVDGGHFILEYHCKYVADTIINFLKKQDNN
jgi:pimeloyl-ACP methyl ester carboxylesterase